MGYTVRKIQRQEGPSASLNVAALAVSHQVSLILEV